MSDIELRPERILALEFEHARDAAAQILADRSRCVNVYLLLSAGVSVFTVTGSQLAIGRAPEVASASNVLLYALLGCTGWFTVMRLVRLRQAWCEAAAAMNRVKDLYLTRFPELKDAFLWRSQSMPAPGRLWTTTFNLALLIMILDSAALAVAVHSTGFRVAFGDYAVDVFAAAILFAWQLFYYFFQLPAG
jgi:hypothetical protein